MTARKKQVRILVVLDESGSMNSCSQATISGFNEFLQQQQKENPTATISITRFASYVRPSTPIMPVREMPLLDAETYYPAGMTALYDAIGSTLKGIAPKPTERVIMVVMTDGEENNSKEYSRQTVAKMIKDRTDENTWSFVYIGANQDSFATGASLNIPRGNTMNYVSDPIGTQVAFDTLTLGMSGYTKSGKAATQNFFTDLSRLTKANVRKDMQNISHMVSVWAVAGECEIKPFCELNSGRPYNIGSAYYQLTKSERVQAGKHVLLIEKNSKVVYGNEDARDILGIPPGPVKIVPGNHGDWDIFIQSTSTNRKLVRGTKVIYFKY